MWILLLAVGLLYSAPAYKKKSFEGEVHYDVQVKFKPDSKLNDTYRWYFSQKYGSLSVLYVSKKGDLLKTYPKSGELGFEYINYLTASNVGQAKYRQNDTIYTVDSSINSLQFISKQHGPNNTIHGYECRSIIYTGWDAVGKDTIRIQHFYTDKIYLDPKPYKNCKDFFANEMYAETQSVPLALFLDYGSFVVIYYANKIEEKKVDEQLFKMDASKPQKTVE